MPRFIALVALGGALGLGACAVPGPVGPTVTVLPGPGKGYPEFQREDYGCRQQAAAAIGYGNPAVAANQAGVGSAIVGTGLGAAAGALLGAAAGNPGAGAAIGAGSGLLLGGAMGANNGAAAGYGMQHQYNVVYVQCMAASGNRVPGGPPYPAAYAPGPGGGYGPPPGGGYGPPPGGGYGMPPGGGYGMPPGGGYGPPPGGGYGGYGAPPGSGYGAPGYPPGGPPGGY